MVSKTTKWNKYNENFYKEIEQEAMNWLTRNTMIMNIPKHKIYGKEERRIIEEAVLVAIDKVSNMGKEHIPKNAKWKTIDNLLQDISWGKWEWDWNGKQYKKLELLKKSGRRHSYYND